MPSPVSSSIHAQERVFPLRKTSFITRIGVLAAAGLILFLFESAIPRPLPWLKPGLSNLVTLIALYCYGFRAAFLVMLIRVITGAFVLGTLFNPVFLFALSGGIVSTVVMALLYTNFSQTFSVLGVSFLGAFTHNFVQLLLAAFLIVGSTQVFYLMPIMLLSSLFSGFLVGVFAHYIIQKMEVLRI
ncbi:MAG: Gx transporter family protein [Caldithrix sp.]|nr:MAG: Gx transporter family protein [Caldithrix sp.]